MARRRPRPDASTGPAQEAAPPLQALEPVVPEPRRTLLPPGSPVDDFGHDAQYAARVTPHIEYLFDRYFQVDVEGAERVPSTGPVILVANHGGTVPLDWLMLQTAVRRSPAGRLLRPLMEDALHHLPFIGPFMSRVGGVRACPENALRLLEAGEAIAVFPEGMKGTSKLFRERYHLQRFGRGGFVKLAMTTGAPVLPVAIVGSEETHPLLGRATKVVKSLGLAYLPVTPTFPLLGPLGLWPLPSRWMISFGAPVHVPGGPEQVHDRALAHRMAETMRGEIQAMVEALKARRGKTFDVGRFLR
jgi:1-acyl-sn-glycerol-3-phosphate acyltransferase